GAAEMSHLLPKRRDKLWNRARTAGGRTRRHMSGGKYPQMLAGNIPFCILAISVCAALAPSPAWAAAEPSPAAQLIATARADHPDVPRADLAARLMLASLASSPELAAMRQNAARELAGRPDGVGSVSAAELAAADDAIARAVAQLRGGPSASFCALA